MKKLLLSVLLLFSQFQVLADPLTIVITEGAEGALPIAVVPFAWQGSGPGPDQDAAAIVRNDLERSGRFKPMPAEDIRSLAQPKTPSEVEFRDWRAPHMDYLVIGQVSHNRKGGYDIRFWLFDVFKGEQLANSTVSTTQPDLRTGAHLAADIIYEKLMGERGAFSTRVAYITSTATAEGKQQVRLQVADADGYNRQAIVTSQEPLMSPAWSPDGQRLAYVSFEKGRPSIYVQEVYTGKRHKVASYKGINGAPAWSPDGRKLALTLSKDGNPDIYVLDLGRKSLRKLTRHYAIDTEPAWSPDGRTIVFTSDRGGKPQIYRVPSVGGKVQRVTFEGSYNARASYSPDGKSLVMVTRENGQFRIGVLDLENGVMQVLSRGRLDESPSFAPNGSMIIYATKIRGKGELATVSVDGSFRQRLPGQAGDVREPVWSPFSRK
jgi:TolB protein